MKSRRMVLVLVVLLCSLGASIGTATSAPVVLVTGFEPFQNYTVNPSGLIAEALNGTSIAGASVVGIVLPVDYNESITRAVHAITLYHPMLVISCGLNQRSHDIRVEKIGVNLKRLQKENGRLSFPRRINASGPFLRVSPLPTAKIVHAIKDANISVRQSFFAGMYVCNSLFYQLLGYAHEHESLTRVAFIHVPLLDSQDPQGMPLPLMMNAVTLSIQVSLDSAHASLR